jgi:hypothetical protein
MIIELELLAIIIMLWLAFDFWKNFISEEGIKAKDEITRMVRDATNNSKVLSWEEPKDETVKTSEETLKRIIKK